MRTAHKAFCLSTASIGFPFPSLCGVAQAELGRLPELWVARLGSFPFLLLLFHPGLSTSRTALRLFPLIIHHGFDLRLAHQGASRTPGTCATRCAILILSSSWIFKADFLCRLGGIILIIPAFLLFFSSWVCSAVSWPPLLALFASLRPAWPVLQLLSWHRLPSLPGLPHRLIPY